MVNELLMYDIIYNTHNYYDISFIYSRYARDISKEESVSLV